MLKREGESTRTLRFPWAAATLLVVLALGCNALDEPDPNWKIVPAQRAGAVQRASSEHDLVLAYGEAAVQTSRIELGEGEAAPGTLLFTGDSARRVEVLWKDTVARKRPDRLTWRGRQSRWQLPRGISLGISLRELERLNGRAFTLAGFGWDYGGVVVDWRSGALDSLLPGVRLYLDPGPAHYESKPYAQVLGDRDYPSSHEAMQELDPRVYQIFMDFE